MTNSLHSANTDMFQLVSHWCPKSLLNFEACRRQVCFFFLRIGEICRSWTYTKMNARILCPLYSGLFFHITRWLLVVEISYRKIIGRMWYGMRISYCAITIETTSRGWCQNIWGRVTVNWDAPGGSISGQKNPGISMILHFTRDFLKSMKWRRPLFGAKYPPHVPSKK